MEPCWHIFRSWAPFLRSWPLLGHFLGVFWPPWPFRSHFFGSGIVFGVSGDGFSAFTTTLLDGFRSPATPHGLYARNATKPQFVLGFCMVFAHRTLCAQATQRRKIVPGPCQTELPAKGALKTRLGTDSGKVWRSLGRHLAGFCSLLGGSWPLLGASWASLGHFLGALGCLLAARWSFRAALWLPGTPQASILESLGTSPTRF